MYARWQSPVHYEAMRQNPASLASLQSLRAIAQFESILYEVVEEFSPSSRTLAFKMWWPRVAPCDERLIERQKNTVRRLIAILVRRVGFCIVSEEVMSLKDKRIVILGGSSGIGFATAKAAADEGALVIVASSDQERVAKAQKQLPPSAEGHVLNLLDEGGIKSFFEKIGAYDHLVYTAGNTLLMAEQKDLSFQDAQVFFGVRYWGVFLATKYGAGQIRDSGSIVLSSGMAAGRPRKGRPWYRASAERLKRSRVRLR
jgi:hypothetical protein